MLLLCPAAVICPRCCSGKSWWECRGSHPSRKCFLLCKPHISLLSSALSVADPSLPQHKQLEFNFPQGKDLILPNYPEEFWWFQNFFWGFGALVPVPLRVIDMQYKPSCVWSFQIRLKPIYSGGQKGQKESRKTAFVSVHCNEFHGKLASESIQSWMYDAGFVLVGLSCYRRWGFLFCEVLKGFESFVILLLISVWQCHAWSKQGSTEKNRTQPFPCLAPYSCSVGKNPKLFQCQEISPV